MPAQSPERPSLLRSWGSSPGSSPSSARGASSSRWRTGGWWCRGGNVRDYWGLYRTLAGAYVRSRLQYRWSFWLGIFVTVITDLVPLMLIGIVFTRFPAIRGWHWRDIALIYGLDQLAFGLVRCFSRQLDNFDQYIVSGDFDSILIRPLPPLFHLIAARFEIVELGRLTAGVVVLCLAARAARVPFTVGNAALALAAAAGGALILFSFI